MTTQNDGQLDAWIGRELAGLARSLNAVLDLDAGLRDAKLPAAVDGDLGLVLNVEAGLRAIVPERHSVGQQSLALARYAREVATTAAHERLVLRSGLPLPELLRLASLVRVYDQCGELSSLLTRAARQSANGEWIGVLSMMIEEQRVKIEGTVDAVRRDLDPRVAGRLILANAKHLFAKVGMIRTRTHVPEADRMTLVALLQAALRATVMLRDDVVWALSPVVDDVVSRFTPAPIARALDSDCTLLGAWDQVRIGRFGRGLADVIKAVSDFTKADLTDARLDGLDLIGVRWSARATRWPLEWVDEIRYASVWINGDVYEIRDVPRAQVEDHVFERR